MCLVLLAEAAVGAQETVGAAFFLWANSRPENAFFREEDFDGAPGQAFVPHPTSEMALPTGAAKTQAPYWIWQVRSGLASDQDCTTCEAHRNATGRVSTPIAHAIKQTATTADCKRLKPQACAGQKQAGRVALSAQHQAAIVSQASIQQHSIYFIMSETKHMPCEQNTVLDMASLAPVVDNAFSAAGILLRPEVAEARVARQQPESAGASIVQHVSRRLQRMVSQWTLR